MKKLKDIFEKYQISRWLTKLLLVGLMVLGVVGAYSFFTFLTRQRSKDIGPNNVISVNRFSIITASECPFSAKSSTGYFELRNLTTNDIIQAQVVPPPLGETNRYYIIENIPPGEYVNTDIVRVYALEACKITLQRTAYTFVSYEFIIFTTIVITIFFVYELFIFRLLTNE